MALDVDLSEWPLACIAADDEGADGALIGEFGALLDRRERFGLVLDVGKQSGDEQAVLAAWLQRTSAGEAVRGRLCDGRPEATLDRNRELIAAHPDAYPFPAWVDGGDAARGSEECSDVGRGACALALPAPGFSTAHNAVSPTPISDTADGAADADANRDRGRERDCAREDASCRGVTIDKM